MKKIREVIRLHLIMGMSSRKIQAVTGVARTTVQDYIKRLEASNLTHEECEMIDDDALREKLYHDPARLDSKNILPARPLPDMNELYLELKDRKKTKVTLMLLWEEYKEKNPNGYAYTQFRIHYHNYIKRLNPSMRQTHIGGEKVFVDYSGLTIPVYDKKTQQAHNAQIFVAVLGASGYTFVHASLSQKQEDFILSHVRAYQFFGGTPRIVVPDNLKSAIISHTKHGIKINESYAALARHYSMAIEPARPYRPKDKPKVEQGVQGIQRYILARLRHHKFYDINELNDAISGALEAYNNKVIKHLQKSRTELFEEIDKPYLTALPSNTYKYIQHKVARVNQDYHITLERCNYSVPYMYLKELVDVHYSAHSVEIYHKHTLIATHPRLKRIGETSTHKEHMPKAHEFQHEKMNPQRLRSWAASIGSGASVFVEDSFANATYEAQAYRPIIAVLSLAKLYGKTELEMALLFAVKKRILSTKSIKSILDKKLYLTHSIANNVNSSHAPRVTTSDIFNNHANIRGAENFV